jgi:hypothetical protein
LKEHKEERNATAKEQTDARVARLEDQHRLDLEQRLHQQEMEMKAQQEQLAKEAADAAAILLEQRLKEQQEQAKMARLLELAKEKEKHQMAMQQLQEEDEDEDEVARLLEAERDRQLAEQQQLLDRPEKAIFGEKISIAKDDNDCEILTGQSALDAMQSSFGSDLIPPVETQRRPMVNTNPTCEPISDMTTSPSKESTSAMTASSLLTSSSMTFSSTKFSSMTSSSKFSTGSSRISVPDPILVARKSPTRRPPPAPRSKLSTVHRIKMVDPTTSWQQPRLWRNLHSIPDDIDDTSRYYLYQYHQTNKTDEQTKRLQK